MKDIKEKDVRQLANIIFAHAYSLGAFAGNISRKKEGYNMMLKHMIDKKDKTDGVKKLLDALYD